MSYKDEIKKHMQDMLAHEVPPEQIQLWPVIQKRLAAGRHSVSQQGAKMNNTFGRRMLPAVFAVILLVIAGLATPQGRAVAQGILHFFTRAEGQRMPLSPDQLASPNDEAAPTVPAPSPLIPLAEAESQAGFQAAQLTSMPSGLELRGARIYGKTISLEYGIDAGEGTILLMQSQSGYLQSDWDKVPAEAIHPVSVGGVQGEFVQGTFVVLPGESEATWNSSAPVLRLRWVKDGTWYELTSFGEMRGLGDLDQAAMIVLAENIAYP